MKRRKRLRRTVALLILMVGVTVVAWSIYSRYTDPERIRAMAETYLQQYCAGRVTVGSADFSWREGVRLSNVTVWEASRDEARARPLESAGLEEPVFFCPETEIACASFSTVLGRPEFESIVAHEPTCVIVRDPARGGTNLAGVMRRVDTTRRPVSTSLPSIELRNARVRVMHRDDGRDHLVEDLELTIRGSASPRNPHLYDISWQGGGTKVAGGRSQIDLTTGGVRNVSGGLPWMSLEAVMIAVNARYEAAGAWCDLLGLDGRVRVEDYDFSPAPLHGAGRSATIELSNASLSIPINEHESAPCGHPRDHRYLRFDRVYGTIQVTADDLRAEFRGLFHGSRCDVSATLRGGVDKLTSLDDIDFDARISVNRLDLPQTGPDAPPEHVRFVNHWRALAKFFRDYDPHGPVDLEIATEKRAGANEPIVIRRLTLTAQGGDASCRYFPFRVTNLSGKVEYAPNGVWLRNLRGDHKGGIVNLEGWAEKPNRCAPIELKITGHDIPIDDELCNSLPQRYKKIRDQFHPKGIVDVELALNRTACLGDHTGKWQSHTTLTFDGLSAGYVKFPYPIKHLAGSLVIDQERVRVVDVRGDSGSARVGIEGTVALGKDRVPEPDLLITARDLPLDDVLLSALPDAVRSHVHTFHPTGHFDLAGELTVDPVTKETLYTANVAVHDATIRHEALPVKIDNVSADLRITPSGVTIESATGQYHGADVSATGIVDRADGRVSTNLTFHARNLQVDDELCAAAPEGLHNVLDKWRVDGPISTDTTLQTDPGDPGRPPVVRTVARLDGVSVRHPAFPIPFEEVRAQITFDESGAKAKEIVARYGQAQVTAEFDTRKTGPGEEGTIKLTAIQAELDHTLRDILPNRVRSAWDRRAPQGVVDLHLDRLYYKRSETNGSRFWSVAGRVDLHDVNLGGMARINGMSGTLTVSGPLVDRLGGTALSGGLNVSTVELFHRRLDDIETAWSFAQVADGEGRFALDSVRGNACGGSLTAGFELLFDTEQSRYNVSTAVRNMEIASLIGAGDRDTKANGEEPNVHGLADAHLYLSGQVGDPLSKRGGGRVEIRDGHMYRLPIMLAILHVINLSPPEQHAFDEAEADFFIVGNRMNLENIMLSGSVLALAGSGSMSLPDRGLDLDLVYMSPNHWARVPMLTDLAEWASRPLTELHITGPLFRPTVKARPFRGVSEELKSLFRKKKPKKIEPAGS